jgi:uncharacterized protein (TIGR03437 family)
MNRLRFINLFAYAIIAIIALSNISIAQSSDWQWRELTVASGQKPDARRNAVAVHDPVAKRIILFGGISDSGLLNDTWAFSFETRLWTKLTTTGGPPPPRFAFDAVYDPIGHQIVIYAGQGAGFFNDTWTLNLNTLEWRDVSPASNNARPKARYGSASIFDPVSRSLVQFAGFTSESGRFQDTQSFGLANNTWTDWTPAGNKPQVRCLLTAAFDKANRRMIIYGGQRNGPLDDLWSFDIASRTWTNLTVATRPAGRWFAASFVGSDGRFILFGGFTGSGNNNETWSFDFRSNQWTKLTIDNSPSPRNGMASAYVEAEDRLIIIGGASNSGVLNDVWELRKSAPATALTTVSAASFDGTLLAAESIVAAFGTNLATATQAATSTPLPTTLAGTTIKVRDSANTERNAPLFFVSPTQVNFLIPSGTAAGAASLTLTSGDGSTAAGTVQIANVAPSLFSANASGQGVAAAVALRIRANGEQVTEPIARWDAAQNRFVAVPIDLSAENEQVFLILFGTGLRYRSSLSAVSARIGGADAQVLFAGAQNDFAGLDQINVVVPRSLAGRGDVDVALTVDGKAANAVRVTIK